MWVARDKDGTLFIYQNFPIRKCISWKSMIGGNMSIDKGLFPNLNWEDEPIEVELNNVYRHFIQCDKCGKAFSYLLRDVHSFTMCVQPSSEYEEEFDYVNCPHCKSEVYI